LRPKQQVVLDGLQRWKVVFLRVCQDEQEEQDPHVRCILSVLLMHWEMCHTWLSASIIPLEISFDHHLDAFVTILHHAEVILQHRYAPRTSGVLPNRHHGTISVLYFVATKCRDPVLRRKSLDLLRQMPLGEGLWGSIAAPGVVERMIAYEEGHERFLANPTTSMALMLPPESRRIHHIALVRKTLDGAHHRIKLQLSKPVVGADGASKMVHEDLWVEDCLESSPMSLDTCYEHSHVHLL